MNTAQITSAGNVKYGIDWETTFDRRTTVFAYAAEQGIDGRHRLGIRRQIT
jgi:hypothetical protein